MASTPDTAGPRHVGRVVDPSVREDGEPEPDLQLASDFPPTAGEDPELSEEIVRSATPPPVDVKADPDADPVHPVRARLMARAAAARPQAEPSSATTGSLDEIGRSHSTGTRPLDMELDLVGTSSGRPPAAPLIHTSRSPLSPTLVAAFSSLLGLAVVATIIALAIHLGHVEHPSRSAATAPPPPASAAAVATTAAALKPPRQRIPGPWRIADEADNHDYRIIKGEIGRDPFLKAIQDAGVDKSDAYRVLTALKDLKNLDKCDHTDTFQALVERSTKKLTAFEYIVSKEEVYQARAGKDGLLKGSKLDFKMEREQVKGALVFDGDFARSAQRAGFEPGLAKTVADAIAGHMDIDDMKRGDVVRVVAQEVTVLGEFSRYAGLEALDYKPADPKDKPLRIYYYRDAQNVGAYYSSLGKAPYEGGWRFPLPGAHVTSPFNLHRMHPILHKIMPHLGTDIGAPVGTPVHASSYGVVERMSGTGATGNLVMLKHSGGIETGYAHLSRFAPGLKVGDHVKRMQVIGYVGNTGRSTGPHLHWIAKKDGKFMDAMELRPDSLRVLPPTERDAFAKVKAHYDELLDGIAAPAPLPAEAAPEPAAASNDNLDEPDEPSAPTPAATPAPAPVAAAPAAPPATQPAAPTAAPAPAAPAPAGQTNPVYLTDKELLKAQSATDDGEVSQ